MKSFAVKLSAPTYHNKTQREKKAQLWFQNWYSLRTKFKVSRGKILTEHSRNSKFIHRFILMKIVKEISLIKIVESRFYFLPSSDWSFKIPSTNKKSGSRTQSNYIDSNSKIKVNIKYGIGALIHFTCWSNQYNR